MTKEVIALELGYYGQLRHPGTIFEVPDDEPASEWFVPTPEQLEKDKKAGKNDSGSLEDLKANQLKELLDKQGIKYPGNASREKLIDLLTNPPHPDDEDLA